MKRIHVAAAVIHDKSNNVLIARRPLDKHMGGLWEFPGGKVEPDEVVTDALCRELDEEVGIQPTAFKPLIRIRHDYPDKSVLLDVWTVTAFTGKPHGKEGQPVKWVSQEELSSYEFPAANQPIITAACLPERYLVTGQFADKSELVSKIKAAFEKGISLVQFRAPWLSEQAYRDCLNEIIPLFSEGQQLIAKGDLALLEEEGIAGLHLTSGQLKELHSQQFQYSGSKWLAASCHDEEQIKIAEEIRASFVTVSPVAPTSTHPDASPLGWEKIEELIERARVPVYCLGGMGEEHLPRAQGCGAQGIAAIGCWW
ncbi:Nudix family hydrolase [Sansalvadorimonas verongulae]|uniref:Nudix family hydrolase n=1 Tax=Sansalvadorimonas verongulae TaxID=2172824 RepID=UPI0012BBFF26|nr:Nudix family hydrolase [Sansalvadorimonas verongulae]MTI15232.1 Nudix family hydrolase [Sansalvadorimonas verongulae]